MYIHNSVKSFSLSFINQHYLRSIPHLHREEKERKNSTYTRKRVFRSTAINKYSIRHLSFPLTGDTFATFSLQKKKKNANADALIFASGHVPRRVSTKSVSIYVYRRQFQLTPSQARFAIYARATATYTVGVAIPSYGI